MPWVEPKPLILLIYTSHGGLHLVAHDHESSALAIDAEAVHPVDFYRSQ
jgi:hypothetical protein